MRTTYIATNQEAANLASGKQTAIVTFVKTKLPTKYNPDTDIQIISEMLLQHKPYQVGAQIIVREGWQHTDYLNINREDENSGYIYRASENGKEWESNFDDWFWRSPATMPRSAARTKLLCGETVCKRIHDVLSDLPHWLNGDDGIEQGQAWYRYIVGKFGQAAWDNNAFIFITKIEKI